ncbi:MAG: hypothetical protein QOF76_1198 [Solirubrobacteraceae bacterium]|nr:hypothetical protein [Solirubrobacteraceae bacterium]
MLAATARGLDELGLLDPGADLDAVPGQGYLRVGLRCLASAGWTEDAGGLRWTAAGRAAMAHRERYVAAGRFLARFDRADPRTWTQPWAAGTEAAFAAEVAAHERWRATADPDALDTIRLDATLALPALLWLRGARGLAAPDGEIARLLTLTGWTEPDGAWSAYGRTGLDFVDHLGLVGSYLPMLAKLPELYRGERLVQPGPGEWHCERELNIEASAAAHRRYFADADGIIDDLFSRTPRPSFVADMGCGEGSWLAHVHGRVGDGIRYVGVDFSPEAIEHARAVLEAAGVQDPILLQGDVSQPAALAEALAGHGLDMEDGLHIRSFIDHNRSYLGGDPSHPVPGWSSGAYVAPDGHPLTAREVECDLVDHLRRWAPYAQRHGLIVIEAHCVAPQVTRRHLGALHSLTFDAYHGLSHQYPIEHPAFMRCCRLAGLQPASHVERRYPATRPFVAVSLNRLMPVLPAPRTVSGAPRADTWRPEPGADLRDGVGLHELMFTDGDLGHPRTWCSGATGVVVGGALEAVERRVETAEARDVVRVLDYGAGTGLAAIELIKACAQREVEARLAARGATLELLLVDIPGSWFAQGYALLHEIPWTQFHALRAADGRFRPLLEVTAGETVDAVMANMVFHLLGPKQMDRAAADIASVLRPGGSLHFSSPDLGPASDWSLLFHAPNRLLRERWLAALDAPDLDALASPLRAAVAAVDPETRAAAQHRADRRILPAAQTAGSVGAALGVHLDGEVEQRTYELLAEESLLTMLVPSNQSEFLPEITDPALREAVVRHLLATAVLPELMGGPAGTALGLNVQWTLGHHTRRLSVSAARAVGRQAGLAA